MSAALTEEDQGVSLFYLAIADTLTGDDHAAQELVRQAYAVTPMHRDEWISELAGIGQQQPAVLKLIPTLLAAHTPRTPNHTAAPDGEDSTAGAPDEPGTTASREPEEST